MKKILFMFAAVAVAAVSCAKEEMDHNDLNGQKNGPKSDIEFTAGLEVATKTALDGTKTLWVAGDEISVNGAKFVTEDAGETATFSTTETFAAAASYSAVYPYSAGTSFTAVTVPATQTVAAGSYDPKATVAVAVSETHDLNFKNVTALLKFQVSASATEVTIESDEVLAGKVKVNYNNGQPTYEVVEGVKTVTVKGTFETGKSYYVAVLPSAKHTFKVSVDQSLSKQSTKDSEVLRGYIMNMGTLDVTVQRYKVSKFWVYGGTGPDYGGAGWVDLHNKTWWFDEATGHGVKAELDNYLELAVTAIEGTKVSGKCTNWAGKDGKNWDTWFYNNKKSDGTERNPDAPKDGANFYRQIPIGQSTWVRDYAVTPNTITFTAADGKTTVLEILEPGYEFVPGYNDKNAVSNTRTFPRNTGEGDHDDLTVHAKLTGGVDKWGSIIYTEIDKVFWHPRDFFIDLDKVDVIPAEAKTSEAKWTPEVSEPEVVTSLAGTYKFRDGKTVGGKALPDAEGKNGNITAKGLVEQYGGWDPVKASINSMKDDKYTFTATGTDANGNETGTVTFDKGADGATWNYKLLDNMTPSPYVEYDGTEMYCIFSIEGTTTYVYDATAGKVTLSTDGREYVVDFLVPGTYKYSTIDVTVPTAAAFGLHLDLGYTEARVAGYAYTDNGFARHYVWARHHVFMFDKQ